MHSFIAPRHVKAILVVALTLIFSLLSSTLSNASNTNGTVGTNGPLSITNGQITTTKSPVKSRIGVAGPLTSTGAKNKASLSSDVIVITPTTVTGKNATTTTKTNIQSSAGAQGPAGPAGPAGANGVTTIIIQEAQSSGDGGSGKPKGLRAGNAGTQEVVNSIGFEAMSICVATNGTMTFGECIKGKGTTIVLFGLKK